MQIALSLWLWRLWLWRLWLWLWLWLLNITVNHYVLVGIPVSQNIPELLNLHFEKQHKGSLAHGSLHVLHGSTVLHDKFLNVRI